MADDTRSCRRRALAWMLMAGTAGGTAQAAPRAPRQWHSTFQQRLDDWGPGVSGWGFDNHRWLAEPGVPGQLLRVLVRQGSIDPGSMLRRGLPRSGTGFKAPVLQPGADAATLRYRVRFPADFDFVRGGKLPGLYGGRGNSGGAIPSGRDGFSLRLMWRSHGAAEVYAYLPTSQGHGSSLLRGELRFTPGRWHEVQQTAVLNRPGDNDGRLELRLDGQLAGVATGLRLRDVPELRIDGVFFEVFFGGNDDTWAARADTHVDFASFMLVAHTLEQRP